MSLSRLQDHQNADSIVPVLISLQHWTPFFWETNRYGMLVPLLAWPLRNPLLNMIAQAAMTSLAGLAASYLLIRHLFGPSRYWLIAAALQNIWLLLLVPKTAQFDWFVVQCYGVSLCLSFGALIFIQDKRTFLALGLMFLAVWVNSAVFILLIPLVVLRYVLDRQRANLFSSLALIVIGAAAGFVMMTLSSSANTASTLLPPASWMNGWQQLVAHTHSELAPHLILLLWIVVPAAVGLLGILLKYSDKRPLWISLLLAGTAISYYLAIGALTWVSANLYFPRYIYPALLVLTTAMAILVVAPFEKRLRTVKWIPIVATLAILIAALISFGEPSITQVRRSIDHKFGSMTNDIISSRAEVLAGNYWKIWPAVFHVHLVLYHRGDRRPFYGESIRGSGTARFWMHAPNICADIPLHDPEAPDYLRAMNLPLQHERSFATIEEFCEH
jgi:hypothetical protein